MNMLQHSDSSQKFLQLGFHAAAYLITAGLAAFLIAAWVLTEPLFRAGIFLGDLFHSQRNLTMKGKL